MGHRKVEQGLQYTERGQFTGFTVAGKRNRLHRFELKGTRQHTNKRERTYEAVETLSDGKQRIVYQTLTTIKGSLGIKHK